MLRARPSSVAPIYLYARPPPPDLPKGMTSSLHFWSFYKTGQFPLSFEVTRSFRLPVDVELRDRYLVSYSSNTDHYKLIHQYQLLRGFDPTTTDFAQFLGYDGPVFRLMGDLYRFKVVHGGRPDGQDSRADTGDIKHSSTIRELLPQDNSVESHFTTAEDGKSCSSDSSFSTPDGQRRNVDGFKAMNMCRGYTDEANRILNYLEYGMFGEKGQGSDTQRCEEERKGEARDVGLTDLVEQSHHLDDAHGRPPK
ncbi:hypothetical protein PQX77_021069 [Marasmius sp. AFHP31]|nr:hypothetical protein PQX77_021069 [Marasmius sp. AFHP31]